MLFHLSFQLVLIVSKYVNSILKLLFRRSLNSGTQAEKRRSLVDFDKSAHSLHVLGRSSVSSVAPPKASNFLLTHIRYCDPRSRIINKPQVSLINVVASKALFAVTPEGFDVHDSKHGPFFYHVQFSNCREVVELPIRFLKPLADSLPNSGNKVVMLWSKIGL